MNRASHSNDDSGLRALGRLLGQRRRQTRLQGRRLLVAIAASLAVPYVTSWVLIVAFGWPESGAARMSTAFAAAGVSLVVWSYTALRAFLFGARAAEVALLERRLRTWRSPPRARLA